MPRPSRRRGSGLLFASASLPESHCLSTPHYQDAAAAATTRAAADLRQFRRVTLISSPSFLPGRERLVREGRATGPLDNDEAAFRPLMAAVAGVRELVVAGDELRAILRLDGALDSLDRRHGQVVDHAAHRNALVIRNEFAGVFERFLELIGLIVGKLPVARVARIPQLRVMVLDRDHEIDEAWSVLFLGGFAGCNPDAQSHSYAVGGDHGPVHGYLSESRLG